MKVFRTELLLLKALTKDLTNRYRVTIRGAISIPRLNNENKYYNIRITNDRLSFDLDNGTLYSLNEEDIRVIMDNFETENIEYFSNLLWLRNCQENKVDIEVTETGEKFNNRKELFSHLFQKYMICKDAKCLDVIYKLKGLSYSCIIYRDLSVIHSYKFITKGTKVTNVYVNDFDYIFELNGNIEFTGVSPNYETPTHQAYFNQVGRMRTSNSTIRVYK